MGWEALGELREFSLRNNNSTLNSSWNMLVKCLEQCQAHRKCSNVNIFIVKNLRIQVNSAASVSGISSRMLEVESGEMGRDSELWEG